MKDFVKKKQRIFLKCGRAANIMNWVTKLYLLITSINDMDFDIYINQKIIKEIKVK